MSQALNCLNRSAPPSHWGGEEHALDDWVIVKVSSRQTVYGPASYTECRLKWETLPYNGSLEVVPAESVATKTRQV